MIITRKIELFVSNEDKNEKWKWLREIDFKLYKAANGIVSALYVTNEVTNRIKEAEGIKLSEARERAAQLYHSGSFKNVGYKAINTEEFKFIPSDIRAQLNQSVNSNFKNDQSEVLLANEV